MLKNYLKIAVRHLAKNRTYAIINILGLAIGMACCGIIFLYVQDELSYDNFHEDGDQLYQVVYESTVGYDFAQVPPSIALYAKEYLPEVEAGVRLFGRSVSIDIDQEGFEHREFEEGIYFADSNFAQIFTLDMISGDVNQALEGTDQVLLSLETAMRLFGTTDVQGKELMLQGDIPFTVGGVFANWPDNSHVNFEILAPYYAQFRLEGENGALIRNNLESNWMISHSVTYLKLQSEANAEKVGGEITALLNEHAAEVFRQGQTFSLAPIQDLHLKYPDTVLQTEQSGSMRYVYTFSAIALITLLIACFNFINLSTAHSAQRAREVGMRKSLGAHRQQLFGQFLGESLVITFLGFVLALVLTAEAVPLLNRLTDKELSISSLWQPGTIAALFGIFIITGFLGGSYPAFVLTNLNVLTSLKGKTEIKPRVFSLRRVLVTFQFAMSVTLITGAVIIYFQLDYLLNKPLGFDKEQVITVPIRSNSINNLFGSSMGALRPRLNILEEELAKHPDVIGSTLTGNLPGQGSIMHMMNYEGKETESPEAIACLPVDYDFLDLYGIEVVAGRGFSIDAGSDHMTAFLVNETGVEAFGWGSPEEALGRQVAKAGQKEGEIIGVVKDYHYTRLQQPIGPMFLEVNVPAFTNLSVKLSANADYQSAIANIEAKWQEFFPEKTFEYSVLDETLVQGYQQESRLGEIMRWFAILAIIVSCLGSYGLILFHAKRREKEIGVRKVLGASVGRLVLLLFREFTVLYALGMVMAVGLVLVIAVPWLSEFSYRIALTPWYFVLGGGITLSIIWLTIAYRSYHAATANPVDSLRDD